MDSQANAQGGETNVGQAPAQPIPTPAPAQQAAQPMNTVAPSDGGSGNNFFKNLDWVEVGLGALASLTLYFVIYYYRNRVIFEKMEKSQIQKQLDIIKSDIEELQNNDGYDANDGGGF